MSPTNSVAGPEQSCRARAGRGSQSNYGRQLDRQEHGKDDEPGIEGHQGGKSLLPSKGQL